MLQEGSCSRQPFKVLCRVQFQWSEAMCPMLGEQTSTLLWNRQCKTIRASQGATGNKMATRDHLLGSRRVPELVPPATGESTPVEIN